MAIENILPMALRSDQEWTIEYLIFSDLCKRYRRTDVEQVYIAIQAGFAFGADCVDAGKLLLKLRPPGYQGLDAGYAPSIGISGLAFFHWIYDVELVEEGSGICHSYQITRHHDRQTILAIIKTDKDPAGESAKSAYDEQLRRLVKSRESVLLTKRYGTMAEFLFGQ
jgi:hypothetical protein